MSIKHRMNDTVNLVPYNQLSIIGSDFGKTKKVRNNDWHFIFFRLKLCCED